MVLVVGFGCRIYCLVCGEAIMRREWYLVLEIRKTIMPPNLHSSIKKTSLTTIIWLTQSKFFPFSLFFFFFLSLLFGCQVEIVPSISSIHQKVVTMLRAWFSVFQAVSAGLLVLFQIYVGDQFCLSQHSWLSGYCIVGVDFFFWIHLLIDC